MDEYNTFSDTYVNACVDLAIEKACLRGAVRNAEINTLAKKLTIEALTF
ncbi:MAG: hypothetical protein JW700_04145 [Candidatus Aenigmarchaeota archaeon]|nr:hypothetical protein [Candidatus Aenigmarchaeota archaeon]